MDMPCSLRRATDSDKKWLDELRRDVYRDLFFATWGGWDESRHERHFAGTWEKGHIQLIEVDGQPIGMIQLIYLDDSVEVAELQIRPEHQSKGMVRGFWRMSWTAPGSRAGTLS